MAARRQPGNVLLDDGTGTNGLHQFQATITDLLHMHQEMLKEKEEQLIEKTHIANLLMEELEQLPQMVTSTRMTQQTVL